MKIPAGPFCVSVIAMLHWRNYSKISKHEKTESVLVLQKQQKSARKNFEKFIFTILFTLNVPEQ